MLVGVILVCCALTAVFDFVKIPFTGAGIYDRLLGKILSQGFGSVAVILLLLRGGSKLFGKPTKLWALIPCLIIAIDNFPFAAYFADKMELTHTNVSHFLLFGSYCLLVGLFEEIIFRGIVFAVLANRFKKTKKGFLLTYLLSSALFGATHLLNLFAGAGVGPTLLQVGYSTLTGGLFAFALIKTKNVLIPAFIHALYNFCGLLFTSTVGLGTGSVLDFPTAMTMLAVCVPVGLFVVYKVWKYPETERIELYSRLGFGVNGIDE